MRVLIVEDEKTPRELLRDLVPWASHGFTRVDTARNGLEALALLEGGEVDLVLTDVRMPKMDGVELALEVRRRWPDCVLLFLSGYSDKEYLKTAIRVQAQDYLDKPIDLALVGQAVSLAAQTLGERRSVREVSQREEQALRNLAPLRRQALAQGLIRGEAFSVPPEDRFSEGPLRVLAVNGPSGEGAGDWRIPVLGALNADTSPFPAFVAAPGRGSEMVLVADRTLSSDPPSFDRSVEALLGWLDAQGLPGMVRLGVSPPASGVPAVPTVAAQARSALAEAFYRPRDRIYAYRPDAGRVFDLADDTIALWRRLMEAEDHAGVVRQLELLEQRALSLRDTDQGRVRTVWLRALELLLEYVPAWGASERAVRVAKLGRDLDAAPDLPSLAAEARGCFERLFILSPGTLHVGDRIQRARLYIEERFADPDLTVDAIAVYVGFSESYFCTVFKQSQGITVKDFVTRHRIERAKAYLWEKDPPTLADLALKVGFRDPNYFSTVFKRLSGTSPGAYRKKALG